MSELWQIITIVISALALCIGATWKIGMTLIGRLEENISEKFNSINQKFDLQEEIRAESMKHWDLRFDMLEQDSREVKSDLQNFKVKVAEDYWRREDAVRQEVVIHAKVDALASEFRRLIDYLKRDTS